MHGRCARRAPARHCFPALIALTRRRPRCLSCRSAYVNIHRAIFFRIPPALLILYSLPSPASHLVHHTLPARCKVICNRTESSSRPGSRERDTWPQRHSRACAIFQTHLRIARRRPMHSPPSSCVSSWSADVEPWCRRCPPCSRLHTVRSDLTRLISLFCTHRRLRSLYLALAYPPTSHHAREVVWSSARHSSRPGSREGDISPLRYSGVECSASTLSFTIAPPNIVLSWTRRHPYASRARPLPVSHPAVSRQSPMLIVPAEFKGTPYSTSPCSLDVNP